MPETPVASGRGRRRCRPRHHGHSRRGEVGSPVRRRVAHRRRWPRVRAIVVAASRRLGQDVPRGSAWSDPGRRSRDCACAPSRSRASACVTRSRRPMARNRYQASQKYQCGASARAPPRYHHRIRATLAGDRFSGWALDDLLPSLFPHHSTYQFFLQRSRFSVC